MEDTARFTRDTLLIHQWSRLLLNLYPVWLLRCLNWQETMRGRWMQVLMLGDRLLSWTEVSFIHIMGGSCAGQASNKSRQDNNPQ